MPINQQILDYIQSESQKGFSLEKIRETLLSAGWQKDDIDASFRALDYQPTENVSLPSQQEISSAQDKTETNTAMNIKDNNNEDEEEPTENPNKYTVITIILLIFVYPIGVLIMWIWTKWKIWLKLVITFLPVVLFGLVFLLFFGGMAALMVANPSNVKVNIKQSSSSAMLQNNSGSDKKQLGGDCILDSDCESDICVHTDNGMICTDGKIGSTCFMNNDCESGYCIKHICTEGKSGDVCEYSTDCKGSLSCKSGTCQ